MQDDSDQDRRRSWRLFALALAVSTAAHFLIVEVVPGFGTVPELITLEVTVAFVPAISEPLPQFDAHIETNAQTKNGTKIRIVRRAASTSMVPSPNKTAQSTKAIPTLEPSVNDINKHANEETLDNFSPLPSGLPTELLNTQMEAATKAYLEEQKQAQCSSISRRHAFVECPIIIEGTAAQDVKNSKGAQILPPLTQEQHKLTDEELERRANIKGIRLFNFKF